MLGTRACLALFPVVDRLPRRADKKAALGRRQSEAFPLGRDALGAETAVADGANAVVGLFGHHWLAVELAPNCAPIDICSTASCATARAIAVLAASQE